MQPVNHKLNTQQLTTHLFTVRVWQEEVADGVYEWRGSIRHGIDGQVQYFVGFHPPSIDAQPNDFPDNGPSSGNAEAGSSQPRNSLADMMQQMVEQIAL